VDFAEQPNLGLRFDETDSLGGVFEDLFGFEIETLEDLDSLPSGNILKIGFRTPITWGPDGDLVADQFVNSVENFSDPGGFRIPAGWRQGPGEEEYFAGEWNWDFDIVFGSLWQHAPEPAHRPLRLVFENTIMRSVDTLSADTNVSLTLITQSLVEKMPPGLPGFQLLDHGRPLKSSGKLKKSCTLVGSKVLTVVGRLHGAGKRGRDETEAWGGGGSLWCF
jgi:hypothetical protein